MINDPLNAKCSMLLDLDCVVDVAYDTYILQWLFIPSPVLKCKDLYVGEARMVHLALGFVDVQRWSLG